MSDDQTLQDPDPEAGKRVFREWLEDLADRIVKSDDVEWSDAFDALVDIADCSPEPLPPEDVFVTAARRYLQVRDMPNAPAPSEILRDARAELE
jgi:hypothetical protein